MGRLIDVFCFIFLLALMSACNKDDVKSLPLDMDFKHEMSVFVQDISLYAKSINPDFVVIPQNGAELVSITGDDEGLVNIDYVYAIDGMGQESLNFGYNADNEETPVEENRWMRTFLDMAKKNGAIKIMVTDYCSTQSKIENSYAINNSNGYISFAADHRELDNIPNYPMPIFGENSDVITNLQQASNFLYLINPDNLFSERQDFVDAVRNTNYDCVIMDLFYNGEEYSAAQIEELKQKANGGKRLLICYMSIGEAENYRYYWQANWTVGNPSFIEKEDLNWPGNFVVRYWDAEWQHIIFGNNNSYLKKILDAGFNGVYLDIIDAFEQFEN